MQTQSINADLTRFLEVKKAAERRMALSAAVKAQPASTPARNAPKASSTVNPAASFLDLIKVLRGSGDNSNNTLNAVPAAGKSRPVITPRATQPGHIAPASPKTERGLLSAYTTGRLASEAVNTAPGAPDAVQNARKLGNLFDAIA